MDSKTQGRPKRRQPRWARRVVDTAMAVVYLLQMAPYQMGGLFHEAAGISLVALFVLHHVLNAGWLRASHRRGDARAWLSIVLNLALVACVAGIAVSGILMSKHVAKPLSVTSLAHVVRPLHACLTYAGLMAMALHVGLHVRVIGAYLRRVLGKGTRESRSRYA